MATKDISVIRDKKTGDIKNIRDKEIKDAKAKTAVAQTDAVRMKTVDNKEVYIDRNSLVQAIAEVMNSNSQSTIQTLFGADANGNHANINMANLASVLSAIFPICGEISTNEEFGRWAPNGKVEFWGVTAQNLSGAPTTGDLRGILFLATNTIGYAIKIYIDVMSEIQIWGKVQGGAWDRIH